MCHILVSKKCQLQAGTIQVLGKRAANTTADRQQYTNTSKVCDDTMSMRSTDLWVMGPARFHCATLLCWRPQHCLTVCKLNLADAIHYALWLWYSPWFKLPIHGLVWVKSKFDVNFSTQASCVHLQSSGPPVQFSSFSCSFRRNSAK